MQDVIDDLEEEHNAILLMLDILEQVAQSFENNEEVPEKHLNGMVKFFTVFADKCHHGKEENLLFPALVKKGVNLEEEPFSSILEDHQIGKKYITKMLAAITSYKESRTGQSLFVENARNYIKLLHQHIDKENNDLFEITRDYLTPDEQRELKKSFDQFEDDVIGEGVHDQLHIMIDDLRTYYLEN